MTLPSPAPVHNGAAVSPQSAGKAAPVNPVQPTAPIPTPQGTVISSAGSLGAFDGSPAKEGVNTLGVKLTSAGTARKQDAPEIPKDAHWAPPVTLQQAAVSTVGAQRAVVTYVGDGDSVSLRREQPGQFGSKNINCRIDTIDAPEVAHPNAVPPKPGQPFGEEAKRTLAAMIENKQVTLRITREADPGDKSQKNNYGRSLCQIEIEGHGVDQEMLRKGAAWLYRRYVNNPELAKLEDQARASKTGLWADPAPENPETFRHR